MTLQSLKKLRITPLNTVQVKRSSAVLPTLVVTLGSLCTMTPSASADDVSELSSFDKPRFDRASAEERWNQLRRVYLNSSKESAHPAKPFKAEAPSAKPFTADWSAVQDAVANEEAATQSGTIPASAAEEITEANWQLVEPRQAAERTGEPVVLPIEETDGGAELNSNQVLADPILEPIASLYQPAEDESLPTDDPEFRQRMQLNPMSSIVPSADYSPDGDDTIQYICPLPEGYAGTDEDKARLCPESAKEDPVFNIGSAEREFPETLYHWAASNVRYNPLYFEDARLERYGQHIIEPVQSLKSVGLFAAQFASLPYQVLLDPAHSTVSPLGFYRPGEAAPCLKRAVPFNKKAVAGSAGLYTGLIFLIP